MFDDDSCCLECLHCRYIPAKIAIDPADSYPSEDWCEEESENYGTKDGCRWFEPV